MHRLLGASYSTLITRARTLLAYRLRWAYDTQYADASACANAKGRLCEASTTSGYSRKLAYDSLGRPVTTTTKADVAGGTASYQDDLTFNARGQVATRTYPGAAGQRLAVTHTYTALGYLKSVSNTSTGTAYWSAGQQDEYGNLTQQTFGNGVVTTRSYDFMQRLLTSAAGSGNAVQNDSYSHDYAGNLRSRTETRAGAILTYQYDYDNLNRLKTEARSGGAVSGTQTITWAYDDIGNLTSRSDIGTYTYPASGAGAVRPHAVSSITGTVNGVTNPGYTYDANGNILSSAGRSATWTSFNLPATLTRGTNQLSWLYDTEHGRVREQLRVNGALTRTTVYVNPAGGAGLFYEEEIAGSVVKRRHYISGGEGAMAVLTRQSGVADEVRYWHKDHLDSNTVVTNETGAVVERLEYEPFGKRRKADNTTDAAGTLTAISTDRGFTEHEMLDEVGLIHMNGRIFDPAIGRFLSADPTVPHPNDMQSYNHYSYTRNRPLSSVDPSGFDDWGRYPQEGGSAGSGSTGSDIPSPQSGAGSANGGQTVAQNGGNVLGYDAVLTWNNGGNGIAPKDWFPAEQAAIKRLHACGGGDKKCFGASAAEFHELMRQFRLGGASEPELTPIRINLAQAKILAGDNHGGLAVFAVVGNIERAEQAGGAAKGVGGFKVGVTAEELSALNRTFSNGVAYREIDTVFANASRYSGFYNKSASVIRDIAGGHLFENGNKRTASAVVELLISRNGVNGPPQAVIRSVVDRVATGELKDVRAISKALQGF